jgi:serine phosphatase RsbU (regulator of sigma subunit)
MRKIYFTLVLAVFVLYSQAYAQNQHVLDSLNHIYKTAPQDSTKILALADIAYLYYLQFDTCIALSEKGIEWSEKIGYEKGKGRCYNALSASYYRAKDNYFVALSYAQKALEIAEKYQDLKGQTDALNMIAMTHLSLENYEQAFSYFQKCVTISEQNNNMSDVIANTINMGIILEKQKKYQQALEIQLKAVQKAKKLNNEFEGYALSSIGNIYLEQNQSDSAIHYFTQSTHIGKKFNDLYLQAYVLVRLGKAYQKQNQAPKAVQYAEQTLVIANQMNLLTEKKEAYALLYEVHKNKAQYQKAMQYLELFKQANDSLTNTEKAKSVANLENKMNLDKKNQELALLTKDNEQQKMKENIYIGLTVVFSFFVLFLGFAFNQKRKANRILAEQKLEINKKNSELATFNEELHQNHEEILIQRDLLANKNNLLEEYKHKIGKSIEAAQKIQNATLPSKDKMQQLFEEYFIIFKPKDVVSGDFWWANQIQNSNYLIVADCTGHGVSGAMLTMIGASLLDRIILVLGITEPAEILEKLHLEIKNTLQQDQTRNNEGMDIAVAHWHYENEECFLSFAAAKRPLIYAHQGQIQKIAGTRRNIGGTAENTKPFENKTFSLPKRTMLYLCSDGYADQNNAERNNFTEKRFLSLLQQIHDLPADEQKTVLKQQLDEHTKNVEQRDDILVIGVRV